MIGLRVHDLTHFVLYSVPDALLVLLVGFLL